MLTRILSTLEGIGLTGGLVKILRGITERFRVVLGCAPWPMFVSVESSRASSCSGVSTTILIANEKASVGRSR